VNEAREGIDRGASDREEYIRILNKALKFSEKNYFT